jgi:hypothetical protein
MDGYLDLPRDLESSRPDRAYVRIAPHESDIVMGGKQTADKAPETARPEDNDVHRRRQIETCKTLSPGRIESETDTRVIEEIAGKAEDGEHARSDPDRQHRKTSTGRPTEEVSPDD